MIPEQLMPLWMDWIWSSHPHFFNISVASHIVFAKENIVQIKMDRNGSWWLGFVYVLSFGRNAHAHQIGFQLIWIFSFQIKIQQA